jgi:hypothetical protein
MNLLRYALLGLSVLAAAFMAYTSYAQHSMPMSERLIGLAVSGALALNAIYLWLTPLRSENQNRPPQNPN